MKNILILEPDRTVAGCIKSELELRGFKAYVASNADEAISLSDAINPDSVITELSLAGHSGTEFLYEFRTYSDWLEVPIIIYSSMRIPQKIIDSNDWAELKINEFLYKPDNSLSQLVDAVELNL